MITYIFTIEAARDGVISNGFKVKDSDDPAEKQMAGMLDCALEAFSKYSLETTSRIDPNLKPTMISGKNIEAFVSNALKSCKGFDLKKALRDSGYELPE